MKTVFVDMNAYFKEQSSNLTWFVGASTSKWNQLSGPINSYAPWPKRKGDVQWGKVEPFVRESIRLADPEIDFRKYQRIVVVHAGSGGSQSMDFGLSFYYWPLKIGTDDGVTVTEVIVLGEYEDFSVVCHEFAHYLGGNDGRRSMVPDLYDWSLLSKNEYAGIYMGIWDLMSSTPSKGIQGLSSWSRLRLGFIRPKQIAEIARGENASITLEPLETSTEGIMVIRVLLSERKYYSIEKKYYLIENRQQLGFDKILPDSGILIMLADDQLYETRAAGPVRVIDSTPTAARLAKATFDMRADKPARFFDRDNDIAIVIMYKSGLAYKIFIGSVAQGEVVLKNQEKAQAAVKAIDEASASIQKALTEGRTSDLEKAKLLLVNATAALEKQEFDNAATLAKQAKSLADVSTKPSTTTSTRPITGTITTPTAEISHSQNAAIGIIAAAIIIFGLFVSNRKRKKQTAPNTRINTVETKRPTTSG